MTHYPTAILRTGPLSHIWTMRFEAKHQFAKNVMRNTFCFKNVAKTVSKRSQLELAYAIFTDSLYREQFEVGPGVFCQVGQMDMDVAACLRESTGLSLYDGVCVPNWLKLGHYKFYPGAVVVVGVEEGTPLFGRIRILLSGLHGDGTAYVIVEKIEVMCFNSHMYSYEISKSATGVLTCIQCSQLYDHHPLGVHSVMLDGDHIDVVSPRYKLF
jgi:hypothetical protein